MCQDKSLKSSGLSIFFMMMLIMLTSLFMGSVKADIGDLKIVTLGGAVYGKVLDGSEHASYDNKMNLNFEFEGVSPYLFNHDPVGTKAFYGFHNAGEQAVIVNNVIDTNDWFTSIARFNGDGEIRMHITNTITGINVHLEDWTDGNFRDHNVHYEGLHAMNIPAVPEPETYAMMLIGLALVGFMTKHKSV